MNCQKFSEKYIHFEELDSREQKDLLSHLQNCPDCRKLSRKINGINHALKKHARASHFSDDVLLRYVHYLSSPDEPYYDGSKLNKELAADIDAHVSDCHLCQKKVAAFRQELIEMGTYLEEEGVPDLVIGKPAASEVLSKQFAKLSRRLSQAIEQLTARPQWKLIPALATALTVVIVLLVSPVFRGSGDSYSKLTQIEVRQISAITRGSAANALQKSISQFNRENYLAAAEQLEEFLRTQPENPNRAYAEYLCGLSCLMQVNGKLQQLPEGTKTEAINRGIRHLQNAKANIRSRRLQENILWYLAKAYLMKKDAKTARAYLDKIIPLKGRRMEQAQTLLDEIQKILLSGK
ncbi:hypothetical protein B1H10_01300 [candidate division KSB1 bacterium 4484_188]|nr:MAG: hypothetical protein B1H10_01300 [candidate division KSB1 bacterium 4484_188]